MRVASISLFSRRMLESIVAWEETKFSFSVLLSMIIWATAEVKTLFTPRCSVYCWHSRLQVSTNIILATSKLDNYERSVREKEDLEESEESCLLHLKFQRLLRDVSVFRQPY